MAVLLPLALAMAACGGGVPSGSVGGSPVAGGPSQSAGVSAPASPAPVESATAPAGPSPSGPAPTTVAPTLGPSASAGEPGESAPPVASASPSVGPGPASACSGSDENRAFFATLAASVSWDVYCAVLPRGWTVVSGSYRLANGGKLVISYRGPGGATLSLSEGSFCADASGCVPSGGDAGSASFGPLPATLVATDAGGFAIVAARGQRPSWLMVTGGLDQATSVSLGAALEHVAR